MTSAVTLSAWTLIQAFAGPHHRNVRFHLFLSASTFSLSQFVEISPIPKQDTVCLIRLEISLCGYRVFHITRNWQAVSHVMYGIPCALSNRIRCAQYHCISWVRHRIRFYVTMAYRTYIDTLDTLTFCLYT